MGLPDGDEEFIGRMLDSDILAPRLEDEVEGRAARWAREAEDREVE